MAAWARHGSGARFRGSGWLWCASTSVVGSPADGDLYPGEAGHPISDARSVSSVDIELRVNVHRAIPPDSAHAGLPIREGVQHEAVGDLYFAADNFGAAVESYAAALRAAVDRTPAERLGLMLRLARAYFLRADYGASLDVLAEARSLARTLDQP